MKNVAQVFGRSDLQEQFVCIYFSPSPPPASPLRLGLRFISDQVLNIFRHSFFPTCLSFNRLMPQNVWTSEAVDVKCIYIYSTKPLQRQFKSTSPSDVSLLFVCALWPSEILVHIGDKSCSPVIMSPVEQLDLKYSIYLIQPSVKLRTFIMMTANTSENFSFRASWDGDMQLKQKKKKANHRGDTFRGVLTFKIVYGAGMLLSRVFFRTLLI